MAGSSVRRACLGVASSPISQGCPGGSLSFAFLWGPLLGLGTVPFISFVTGGCCLGHGGMRMAYQLERTTSVEASLALAGILPVRQQILQCLLCYMWRHDREALTATGALVPMHHTLASELGCIFFQRSVRGQTISSHPLTHRAIVLGGIDRALRKEWQRRWQTSTQGVALREVLPRVGVQWRLEEAAGLGSTWDLTLVARFLMGHCHLGTFQPPWHEDEDWVECPFCDVAFTHIHLVWECRGVIDEHERCLGGTLPDHVGDWSILLRRGAARLGRFLRMVGLMIDRVD